MTRSAVILLILLLTPPAWGVGKVSVLALFRDKAIVDIDGSRHTLTAGQQTASGVKLISANSKEAILEIDGVRNTYTLGTHIGTNYAAAAGTIVSIAPDSQGMYLVNGSINRFQTRFIVDTGATLITMNRNEAGRFGIDFRGSGEESAFVTASGTGKVYLVRLASVRVGDIELQNVPAAVHDSEFPPIILLGNSFLNEVAIRRDGQLLQLIK